MKNEIDVLNLINKIQTQLIALDKKVDTLIHRSLPEIKPVPKPVIKERMMHTAICADCKKECTIPFKPSADRPVYCKDCFSRRKVISMSGIKLEDKPREIVLPQAPIIKESNTPKPSVKAKKKAVTVKKKPAVKKNKKR